MKLLIWLAFLFRGISCLLYLSPQMKDYIEAEQYCAAGGDVISGPKDTGAARSRCGLNDMAVWYKRTKTDKFIAGKPEGMCYAYGSFWKPCKDKLFFFCDDRNGIHIILCSGSPVVTTIIHKPSHSHTENGKRLTPSYQPKGNDNEHTSPYPYNKTDRELTPSTLYYGNTTRNVSISDDVIADVNTHPNTIGVTVSSLQSGSGIDFNIYEIIILVGGVFLLTVIVILIVAAVKVIRRKRGKTTPTSSLTNLGSDCGKSDETLYATTRGRINPQSHVYATPVISIYDSPL